MPMTRRLLISMAAVAAMMAMAETGGYAQSTSDTDTLYQRRGSRLEKSNGMWTQSDSCGKESFQKFPDYTTEGAAKRDAYVRQCLRRHRLPPRADVAQPLQPQQ